MELSALQWSLIAAGTTFVTVRLVGEFLIDYFAWRLDRERPLSDEWKAPR